MKKQALFEIAQKLDRKHLALVRGGTPCQDLGLDPISATGDVGDSAEGDDGDSCHSDTGTSEYWDDGPSDRFDDGDSRRGDS